MKSFVGKKTCMVSALVLFSFCNAASADVLDMFVSGVLGVYKYSYDTVAHVATLDEGFAVGIVEGKLKQPQGLVVGPDHLLYVAGQDSRTVSRYNTVNGGYVDTLATWASGYGPIGITFGPDHSGDGVSDLYVAQCKSTVDRVPTAGADAGTIYTFTSGAPEGFTYSSGVAFGPDNNLYASNFWNKTVEKFNGNTGAWISTFVTQTHYMCGLDFSDDGSFLFTSRYAAPPDGGVNKVDAVTGAMLAQPFGSGIHNVASVVVGPDHNGNGSGDIYMGHPVPGADFKGNQIDVFDGATSANIGPVVTNIERPKYVAFATPLVLRPGDANYDAVVNEKDAAILAANWLGSEKGWGDGDFNDDGVVNDIDATMMAANWTNTVPASASVPEPNAAVLLAVLTCGFCAAALRRKG